MMRLSIIFVVLSSASLAFSETPEQFFDEANRDYQQGKFTESIGKYEQVLQSGYAAGDLYYNLGNAYYKTGRISKAILCYERALKLMPDDDDLKHNLQLANLMITDKIEPAPRLFVWDWWEGIKSWFSLEGSTWLAYLFYVLLTGSIVLMVLSRTYRQRRIGFISGMLCTVLLSISLFVFFGNLNDFTNSDNAIVTTGITTIKNSPDLKSTDAFVLHEGVKVVITDKVNNWYKIRLADGKVGWMEHGAAEII